MECRDGDPRRVLDLLRALESWLEAARDFRLTTFRRLYPLSVRRAALDEQLGRFADAVYTAGAGDLVDLHASVRELVRDSAGKTES